MEPDKRNIVLLQVDNITHSFLSLGHPMCVLASFPYDKQVCGEAASKGTRCSRPSIDRWAIDFMLASQSRPWRKEEPGSVQVKYCQPPLLPLVMDVGGGAEVDRDEMRS